jgi:hypothetical protein
MEFGNLTRREAQLYIKAYADGIQAFGDTVDYMRAIFGDSIPYSELKDVIAMLAKGHMDKTMAQIMAMYDEKERSDKSFRM